MMRSTIILAACAIASVAAAPCNDQFTIALSGATSPAAKCTVVLAFEECLAKDGGAQGSDSQLILGVKAANGGCIPAKQKVALKTENGVVKMLVGEDSDFVLERQGKSAISFVGLTNDMADVKEAVDVKLAQSIIDINKNNAKDFKALEDKLDKKTTELDSKMATSLKTVDQKLAAADKKVDGKLSAVDGKLSAVDGKLSSVDSKLALKRDESAATAALTALEAKLMASIKELAGKSACSHQGVLQSDGKTCKCNKDISGARCEKSQPESCADVAAPGTYTFKGKKALCYNSKTGQRGWELVYNLATSKRPTMDYAAGFWTESKRNLAEMSLDRDCKGEAFYEKKGYTEILIVAHDAGKTIHGEAVYNVKSDMQDKTFHQHFTGGTNKAFTGTKIKTNGQVKKHLRHNPDRPQSLWGDTFIDRSEALVINKDGGWNAGRNRNRLATTISNSNYGHTFAGMGGWHEHGVGSWITKYEAAPISSYCDMKRGYGNDNNHVNSGNGAFKGSCKSSYAWVKVDYAVFVR